MHIPNALFALWVALLAVSPVSGQDQAAEQRLAALRQDRADADASIWKDETLAQEYETPFIRLWDSLRKNGHSIQGLGQLPFTSITIGAAGEGVQRGDSFVEHSLNQSPETIDHAAFLDALTRLDATGWSLVQSEWHHARFELAPDGSAMSVFTIVLHGTRGEDRIEVTGAITVHWKPRIDAEADPAIDSIDVTGLTRRLRRGAAPFKWTDLGTVRYLGARGTLIAHDLDGDGRSEILCPPANTVYRNRGDGTFVREALLAHPLPWIVDSILADVTGDGHVDLVVAGGNGSARQPPRRLGIQVYTGSADGRFDTPAELAIAPRGFEFRFPTGMAAGDVDGDGDVDLYVPQYLGPYLAGQFPTPYWDANDGFDAYLLLNRGDGTFEDGTEAAGLTVRRKRRSFRSLFVDLDRDSDLDLLVVSDFAGIDLYANNGRGEFSLVTSSLVDTAANFGMGCTFGDFDGSGTADLYVTGMASTTARRLHAMDAGRSEFPEHQAMRLTLGYGNRMYLSSPEGRYVEPTFADDVARSGWSWGVVASDVNLDGYDDLFVANGNLSGDSARDYCTRFWCHDIYSSSSEPDPVQLTIFREEGQSYMTGGMSWNGFEHHHLFLNEGGERFFNAAWGFGLATEADGRAVIADDFDGDGRPDLLISERTGGNNDNERRLRIAMNRMETKRHWIGIRLHDAPGVSTVGARVRLEYDGGARERVIVVADSFAAQQAPQAHFGLGIHDSVHRIHITWPNGQTTVLDGPGIDRWHDCSVLKSGDS